MDYRQNLFYVIKLLFLATILAELSVIRMIIQPVCLQEHLHICASIGMYIEHIILSILFLSLGALIFLKRA